MGLFGFGKKKRREEQKAKENDDESTSTLVTNSDDDVTDVEAREDRDSESTENKERGPWDIADAPEEGNYLDLGGYRLPAKEGVSLRLQVNQEKTAVMAVTVTYGDSSLELTALATRKSEDLWDDVREELLADSNDTTEQNGVFGKEIVLSITVNDKKVPTRIVGVDGSRWMLRGIFTGKAAIESEEKKILDDYFSSVIVDRGDVPLAPRDLLPLHPPVAVSQEEENSPSVPGKPKGPLTPLQNTQVQQTLSRGPMFSEVR